MERVVEAVVPQNLDDEVGWWTVIGLGRAKSSSIGGHLVRRCK